MPLWLMGRRMVRRNALMIVCLGCAGTLALACALMVLNFVRLAEAQSLAQNFVREAVEKGSAMRLPDIAPAAASAVSRETMLKALDRARRIGPLIDAGQPSCAVEADVHTLCAGQIMVCIIKGTGREGAFEADVAMCRGNDTESYRVATTRWTLDFTDGEPVEEQDRSHL